MYDIMIQKITKITFLRECSCYIYGLCLFFLNGQWKYLFCTMRVYVHTCTTV